MISSRSVARYAECKSMCCLTMAALFSALAPDALIVGALLVMCVGYAVAAVVARRSA